MNWARGVLSIYAKVSGGAAVIGQNRNNKALDIKERNEFFSNKTNKKQERTLKLSDAQLYDVFFLMWLDGIHDKYITITFEQWLNTQKDTSSVFINNRDTIDDMIMMAKNQYIGPYFTNIFNTSIPRVNNVPPKKWFDVIKKIKENINGPSFVPMPAGWERQFKVALITKENCQIYEGEVVQRAKNGMNYMNIGIDQEFASNEERTLSHLISSNKHTRNFLTLGNILDPGRTMLPKGVSSELSRMVIKSEPGSVYFIGPMNMRIVTEKNETILQIEIDIDNNNIIFVKVNGKILNLPQSAGAARKTNNQTEQLSKYMGDALQYLILTCQNPVYTHENGSKDYSYFGSGDSMALVGYDFYSKLFKNPDGYFIADFSKFFINRFAISKLPPGFTTTTRELSVVSALTEFVNKPLTNTELINTNQSKKIKTPTIKYSPVKGVSQASTPTSRPSSAESVGGFSPVTTAVYKAKSPVREMSSMSPKQLKTVEEELKQKLKEMEKQLLVQAQTIKKQQKQLNEQMTPMNISGALFNNSNTLLSLKNAMKSPEKPQLTERKRNRNRNGNNLQPPKKIRPSFINMSSTVPGIGQKVMRSPNNN